VGEGEDESACIACMTNKRCCVGYPCGHMVLCISCARRSLASCAVCRKPLKELMYVFY
jgi:hypothetical protein